MKKLSKKQLINLRKAFKIMLLAFELAEAVSKIFNPEKEDSVMLTLHRQMVEEINQKEPDMKKIEAFLFLMEVEVNKNCLNHNIKIFECGGTTSEK